MKIGTDGYSLHQYCFGGAFGVELDLLAPRRADRPEDELVAESVSYLRELTKEV